jgi:hypothetical protein
MLDKAGGAVKNERGRKAWPGNFRGDGEDTRRQQGILPSPQVLFSNWPEKCSNTDERGAAAGCILRQPAPNVLSISFAELQNR